MNGIPPIGHLLAGRTVAELTGSPKQVAWATDIRARVLSSYEITYASIPGDFPEDRTPGCITDAEFDATIRVLLRIRNADWWITHRDDGSREFHAVARKALGR